MNTQIGYHLSNENTAVSLSAYRSHYGRSVSYVNELAQELKVNLEKIGYSVDVNEMEVGFWGGQRKKYVMYVSVLVQGFDANDLGHPDADHWHQSLDPSIV